MTGGNRRGRYRLGRRAEWICVWHLRLRGYRILARRYRVPVGEIDIIARRGFIVALIEVKARDDLDTAAESITSHQRRRIRNAARAYLSANPAIADCNLRFDAMLIAPGRWPRHLTDAWQD